MKLGAVALAAFLPIWGCTSDGGSQNGVVDAPAVSIDEAFDGDAFDATCLLLEESSAPDRVERVREALAVLAAIGGDVAARNTLTIAVENRCTEWSEDLARALAP